MQMLPNTSGIHNKNKQVLFLCLVATLVWQPASLWLHCYRLVCFNFDIFQFWFTMGHKLLSSRTESPSGWENIIVYGTYKANSATDHLENVRGFVFGKYTDLTFSNRNSSVGTCSCKSVSLCVSKLPLLSLNCFLKVDSVSHTASTQLHIAWVKPKLNQQWYSTAASKWNHI